jgi:hypothetical protein
MPDDAFPPNLSEIPVYYQACHASNYLGQIIQQMAQRLFLGFEKYNFPEDAAGGVPT